MNDSLLFCEKYRPTKIEDCILPESIKNTFLEFVERGEIPNLLLSGNCGVGKTSSILALCNQIGLTSYFVNGSDSGRFLDTFRNQVKSFATAKSFLNDNKHKVVIIDEADNTGNDVQMLLRANIEAYHKTCRFVFTCNYKNRIIEPIHSRCAVIDFSIPAKEKPKLAAQFFDRLKFILQEESIQYEEKVLAELVKKYFPDFRRTINEIQKYSLRGKIDSGILANFVDVRINELVKALSNKEFTNVRKWVVSNLDNDPNIVLRKIYDALYNILEPQSIPVAILHIAKYQYQQAFVSDTEINLLACLTEIMSDCQFK